MKAITRAMVETAAARALAEGFDFRMYTTHKVARDLMAYDRDFAGADYTKLVAEVYAWQKEIVS